MKMVETSGKMDLLIHALLIFFLGVAVGVTITYFGFDGNFSQYRSAELKGEQLEIDRYMQMLNNPKMSDAEVREDLEARLRNRIIYLIEMEKNLD